jgi:thymidylate kinase
VDEGTLHAAHNLFIHVDFEFDNDQLQQFAERVPLPDVVIYVRQSEQVLVERTLKRGHPRIADPTRQSVAKFVHQAVLAFDQLAKHERIAPRTLEVQDGMIVSEPMELPTPQLKRTLEFLRSAIETGTLPTNELDCESTPAAHSGAA